MANTPISIEILPKITTARVGCTSIIGRQTDRRHTDGQATAYSEHERENNSVHSKMSRLSSMRNQILWHTFYEPRNTTTVSRSDTCSPETHHDMMTKENHR